MQSFRVRFNIEPVLFSPNFSTIPLLKKRARGEIHDAVSRRKSFVENFYDYNSSDEYILSKTLISTTRWNHGWMDHGANCREDAKNEKLSVESRSVP